MKREFCPECHELVDDKRYCSSCQHVLMDLEMDIEDADRLVALGILVPYSTGEYNLSELGQKIVTEYLTKIQKDDELQDKT